MFAVKSNCPTGTIDSSGNCVTSMSTPECTSPADISSENGGQCVTTTPVAAPPCGGCLY